MRRDVTLEEISDGKLYGLNDMVRADCSDCRGCSACCRGMGSSITLDPLDVHRLTTGLGLSFEQLLADHIELNVADGAIVPNLKMNGAGEACSFLNESGRCRIHPYRPGICRLFPLGRYYEDGSFQYFLQIHECKKENRSKVKVRKWIDTPDLKAYETFINQWHDLLLAVQQQVETNPDDTFAKQVNLYILKSFYMKPYRGSDFYQQFSDRHNDLMAILKETEAE